MKKLTLLFVMLCGFIAASAEKVYYDNSKTNWDEVCCYVYGGDGEVLDTWPGTLMSKGDNGLWEVDVPGTPANIIFNNNNKGAQTGDLTYKAGATYDFNGIKDEGGEGGDDTFVAIYMPNSANGYNTVDVNWQFATTDGVTYTLSKEVIQGGFEFKLHSATNEWHVPATREGTLISYVTVPSNIMFAAGETYKNVEFIYDSKADKLTINGTTEGDEPAPEVGEIVSLSLVGDQYPENDEAYKFVEDESGVWSLNLKYGLRDGFRLVGVDAAGNKVSFSNGFKGDEGIRLGKEYTLTRSSVDMGLLYNTTSNIVVKFVLNETATEGRLSFEVNRHVWDYEGLTIYFRNTQNWTEVNCYAWNTHNADNPDAEKVENAEWPGVAMAKVEGTDDLWVYNSPEMRYQNVIFNGGGNQTEDLNARLGGIYTPDMNRRSDLDNILETFVPEAPATTVVKVAGGNGVTLEGNAINGTLTSLGEEFEVIVEVAEGADHAAYYKVTPAVENGIEMMAINGFEKVEGGKIAVPVGDGTLEVATAVQGVLSAPVSYSYSVSKNTTGVENVSVEADGIGAEYFNLQGVRVAAPAKGGIYIVRKGNEVAKVRF